MSTTLFIVDNSIILVSYVYFCKSDNVYRIIFLLLLLLLLIVVLENNNNRICESEE